MRFYSRIGIKKHNIFNVCRFDRFKAVLTHKINKNRIEHLICVESHLDSLFLTARPVNVRHVLMQSIKIINHDRVEIFEKFDNVIILEMLTD